ncbi:MAG: hypothetical protein Q8R98_00535 [Rubrivivax sp.]|nr:hypothetical protein [Rubrivivax sp.]MDP3225260.1 hypothetical protein [Rubrivivax sp.]MDP3610315.1 hypothetical protein [Rubrivivax sp.]
MGDSCVVLEAVSGETATADALEAATLACFETAPHTLDQLVAALASDLSVEPNPELQDKASGLVQQFLATGWLQELESGG